MVLWGARGGSVGVRMMFVQPKSIRAATARTGNHAGAPAIGRWFCVLLAVSGRSLPALAQQAGPTPESPGTPVAPGQGSAPPQNFASYVQSTFTEQFSPGFAARFTGPESFPAYATGRETLDVTAYLGVRPWQGAELWWNPEIDQGFGIGNTFGVAGYISGEAYKVGAQDPYLLQQRLFLRQTVDLGGDKAKIDPDLNQLAGTQTADRLVITAGKFSVVDVFDTNTYAHDPRHDFLNWSVIDQGSFDYAANAWGYTYGAAAELYWGRYAARIGAFNLSTTPNGLNVEPRVLGQFQLIGEIEEDHTIGGQPGKIKFLYWIDRGELGSYLDAIAAARLAGTTPTTADVRSYKTKDGISLNAEQQVATGIGVFLRAGVSSGTVEEDAFTDINKSVSAGVSLAGDRWGRPDDNAGAAFAFNEISHSGKAYLAAGGLGGIIGDGALPNSGPEQVLETFYSFSLYKSYVLATADYQLINHPAYDTGRGPVSLLGVRLHAQF